jgi:hypothetical protein
MIKFRLRYSTGPIPLYRMHLHNNSSKYFPSIPVGISKIIQYITNGMLVHTANGWLGWKLQWQTTACRRIRVDGTGNGLYR